MGNASCLPLSRAFGTVALAIPVIVGAACLTVLVAPVRPLWAQQSARVNYCTSGDVAVPGQYAYVNRGSRCEGLYNRNDSGHAGLTLLSITAGTAASTVGARGQKTITISWSGAASAAELAHSKLTLHAFADLGSRHYQMDTRLPFSVASYDWPTEVLDGLAVEMSAVHLKASVPAELIGAPETVYVPTRIGNLGGEVTRYHLQFAPPQDVDKVSYVLEHLDAGQWSKIGERTVLPKMFRRAHYSFPLDVAVGPALHSSGFYRLKVSAHLEAATDQEPLGGVVIFVHG